MNLFIQNLKKNLQNPSIETHKISKIIMLVTISSLVIYRSEILHKNSQCN